MLEPNIARGSRRPGLSASRPVFPGKAAEQVTNAVWAYAERKAGIHRGDPASWPDGPLGLGLEPLVRAKDGVEGRPHGVVVDQDVEGPVAFEALPAEPERPVRPGGGIAPVDTSLALGVRPYGIGYLLGSFAGERGLEADSPGLRGTRGRCWARASPAFSSLSAPRDSDLRLRPGSELNGPGTLGSTSQDVLARHLNLQAIGLSYLLADEVVTPTSLDGTCAANV